MKRWLKRIRGVVGMGLTWAVAWFGATAILGVVAVLLGLDPASGNFDLEIAGAIVGFIAGASFSTVLMITEGRRRFDEMSLPRFAAWGALGGLFLSALMFNAGGLGLTLGDLTLVGMVVLLGAGSAAGSLALARRADPWLESGDLGLLEGETPDPSM